MTNAGALPTSETSSAEQLSDRDFAIVRDIALKSAGLVLPESKRMMVQSRLARRLRATGAASVSDYVRGLTEANLPEERDALISALTTNVTSFFREAHHFETLEREVLPDLIADLRKGGRLRLWSAGCSSGEEAYSLAMLVTHLCPEAANLDVRILATDIDHSILAKARQGTYPRKALEGVPKPIVQDARLIGSNAEDVTMPAAIKNMIAFKQLNLHEPWPMSGTFDVIMCRNVVIYFDAAHQAALWPRFSGALKDQGWLFLGHSERIHPIEGSGFVGKGLTTYRKSASHPGKGSRQWR